MLNGIKCQAIHSGIPNANSADVTGAEGEG